MMNERIEEHANTPQTATEPFARRAPMLLGVACVTSLALGGALHASDRGERTMEPQVDSSGSSPVIERDVDDRLDEAEFAASSRSGNTGSSSGFNDFDAFPSSGSCNTVWVTTPIRWSYSDYVPGVYISYRMRMTTQTFKGSATNPDACGRPIHRSDKLRHFGATTGEGVQLLNVSGYEAFNASYIRSKRNGAASGSAAIRPDCARGFHFVTRNGNTNTYQSATTSC